MPARLSTERWRIVIPYLDRALELSDDQRLAWLASLRGEDADLADDLEWLLQKRHGLDEENFLGETVVAATSRPSLAGQTVGAYTLRALIGQGGMGSVWLAERSDGRYRGEVAVKLLNASLVGPEGEARFRREGSILARLQHPNIAQLIDAGASPLGQPYLILERVDGARIDRYCDGRRLGVEERIRLFLDVLGAVSHAHANLIVHRDIKPSNVQVAADGRVKLLDFGIAKLLESGAGEDATALTREGVSMLTPEYAAPEQLTGGDITTATDVYALGVLLYLLLSGRHPTGTGKGSPAELIRAIVDTEPMRVSEAASVDRGGSAPATEIADARATTQRKLRGALRGDLENILAKALKKSPSERYPSAEAMGDDLRRYLSHQPIGARRDSIAYRTSKFVRRNRSAVALAALSALALVAGLIGTVSQARRARTQAALADGQRLRADAERDFALRQLSRAEALNDLNSFVLSDAAPLGKSFTVGDLLARAERIVERQPPGDTQTRAVLLVAIGRQYQVQDEWDRAREVLGRAHVLATKSGEPATRAQAACALASAVAEAGDTDRAEQLLQRAERDLPGEPLFTLHRVFCRLRSSEVANRRGDAALGVERAQSAQRLIDESALKSARLELSVAMRVAESYRLAGRLGEADVAFEKAFGLLSALGRDETETAGTLLNNWALTLRSSGRPLEAEPLFGRAIQIASAAGSDEKVSPMLLNNMARTLADLERLSESADYAERAYAKAQRLGAEAVVNLSLLARAAIYRQQGNLQRAAQMLGEFEPRATRMWPAGHPAFAALASEQAQLAQARGDLSAAHSGADRALALARAGTQQPEFVQRLLVRRAEVHLQAARPQEAAADARAALELARQFASGGAFSSNVGLSHLALGRALEAQGKVAEAAAAFASAVQQLEPSLGRDHPATRTARGLAARPAATVSR